MHPAGRAPTQTRQRLGSSTWQTGWARKLKTDHFLAKMHTVIEHFHQNCTIMPKNYMLNWIKELRKVDFFTVIVGESKSEFFFPNTFWFLFPLSRILAALDQLGQANGGVKQSPRNIASEQIIQFSFQFKNLSIIFAAAARISWFLNALSCLGVSSWWALNIKDTQVAWLKS